MKTKYFTSIIKVQASILLNLIALVNFADAQFKDTTFNSKKQYQNTIIDKNIVQLTVTYDAAKGVLVIPKETKKSRFFTAKKSIYTNFKITNINPFFNSITVKAEQKSILSEVPAKYLSVLEPKKEEVKAASLVNSADANTSTFVASNVRRKPIQDASFKDKLSTYLNNWITLQKLIALSDFLEPQIKKELKVDANSFKKEIEASTIAYLNLTETGNIEKPLADKSASTYKSLITDYGELKTEYNNQSKNKPNSSLKSATNKKDGSITISIVKDSVPDNPYKEVFTYITTVYNKLLDESTMKTYQDKIDKGILLYQTIQNESYSMISEPKLIEDESDYLDLTLTINNTDGKTVKTITPIRIYQFGGLKIDFSTGIAFGLGGAKDRSYSLQQPDASSLVIRQNANYNQFFPSVAAFIHIYGRDYYRSVRPALSFGISTNPAGLEQTSFYAGSSLMFRNSMLKRVVLSGGLAAANVNYLKNAYQTDGTYTASNFKNYTNLQALKDEDLVERKFRLGWFVSVSYNLSSK